jgi:hypothetical protein
MRSLSALLFVVSLLSGCAQDITDIDRTNPNRVHKSMFDGVWYFHATVAEVAPDADSAFEGISSQLWKIRWEITETELRGWRVDETVLGMDEMVDDCRRVTADATGAVMAVDETYDDACLRKSVLEGPQLKQGYRTNWGQLPDAFKGALVVSFPVSHFDIQRSYNAATGEQSNVIVENASDRKWWDREYLRVSWNASKLTDEAHAWQNGAEFAGDEEPANSDHKIRFLDAAGDPVADGKANKDSEITYFDFAVRSQSVTMIPYGGSAYPACFFNGYYPLASCDPTNQVVRLSFLKTDPVRDFAPVVYDDKKMGRFGYFRTERFTRHRQRGVTESGRIRLASIHNIWKRTYERDGDGAYTLAAVTDDRDRTVAYRRVEIPIEQRAAKPIAYHLSPYFPQAVLSGAYAVGDSWNRAYRRVVAAAWGYQDVAGAENDGRSVPDMFVVCENPVPETVPNRYAARLGNEYFEVCGKPGTRALPGDLRFHFMYWVHDRNPGSPLGYGPSYQDPETGETITGTAWVYGSAVDSYAQSALDMVNAINGVITEEDFIHGEYVREAINARYNPRDPRNQIPADLLDRPIGDLGDDHRIADAMAKAEAIMADPAGTLRPDVGRSKVDRLRRFLANDELADHLLNGEVLAAAAGRSGAWQPGSAVSTEHRGRALGLLTDTLDHQAQREEMRRVAERIGLWTRDNFEDLSMAGLAKDMAARYADRPEAQEEMYQELRNRIFQAVMEHEVGHTLGLRHNFAGSYDAFNYHDNFWRVRKEGLISDWSNYFGGDGSVSIGELMALSTPSADELNGAGAAGAVGGLSEYQYSSVMDYGATFNSDVHGIGKYDEAALLMGYAGVVEVFAPGAIPRDAKNLLRGSGENVLANSPWDQINNYTCLPQFEDRVSPQMDALTEKIHYSRVPLLFGEGGSPSSTAGVRTQVESGLANMGSDNRRLIKFADLEPLLEAERAVRLEEGQCGANPAGNMNPERPVMVPYMFCSDEWVGSVATCNRWDEGADPAAITNRALQSWESYYWFTHYKRDRWSFSTIDPAMRSLSRTYPTLLLQYQQWLFNQWGYSTDLALSLPWRYSVFDSLNRFASMISRPRYGTYYISPISGDAFHYSYDDYAMGEEIDNVDNQPIHATFSLPRGVGRRAFSKYDYEDGYYYFERPLEAGHFWDYLVGLMSQGNASASAMGAEVQAEMQRFYLPFHLVFGEALDTMYSSIVLNRQESYAPRMFEQAGLSAEDCTIAGKRVDGHGSLGRDDICFVVVSRPLLDWKGVTTGGAGAPFAEGETAGQDWADGKPVHIHNNYSTKIYAALYGSAFFTSAWEREFVESLRTWRVGASEDFDIGPDHEVVSFTDPRYGYKYGALTATERPCSANAEDSDPSVGAGFICGGQQSATDWHDATARVADFGGQIDVGSIDCDDAENSSVPDAGQICADFDEAEVDLRRANSGLDDAVSWSLRMRSLYDTFGAGQL